MTAFIVGKLLVNFVLMFVIKFIATIAHLDCSWAVAFIIAALLAWAGVLIISVSNSEIDLW